MIINKMTIPEKLQKGTKRIGEVEYKGQTTMAYIEDDYSIGNLPAVYIGSQGSGKSVLFKNYAIDCIKTGESLFVIDFIKDCELSSSIEEFASRDKLVVLDLASKEGIQGFGYNEAIIEDSMDDFERLKLANLQSIQTLSLVDSINPDSPLTTRMKMFLNAAANVVFVQKESSIKSVIDCLEDFKKREYYIQNLTPTLKEYLADEIRVLEQLDEYSNFIEDEDCIPKRVGTFYSKIQDILDRITILREDFKLKFMYNKDADENVNFMTYMDEGKIVLIKMKESEFHTKTQKNILVTYFMNKLYLASLLRGAKYNQPKRTSVLIDELFQAPTCMKKLEYILPQARTFALRLIVSVQRSFQLKPIMDVLECFGASFFLLTGCTEDDFSKLKNKLPNFQYEDLRDMPKFHSMCLVKYSEGYASFVAKLSPPPRKEDC